MKSPDIKMDVLTASLNHGKIVDQVTLRNGVTIRFQHPVLTGRYVISENPWVCSYNGNPVVIADFVDPKHDEANLDLVGFVTPKDGGHTLQPFNEMMTNFDGTLRCIGRHSVLPYIIASHHVETIRVCYFNRSNYANNVWPSVEDDATLTVYQDTPPCVAAMQPPAIGPFTDLQFNATEIANRFYLLARSSLPVAETDVSIEYVADQVLNCAPFMDDMFSNRSSGRATVRGIKDKNGNIANYPAQRLQIMMDWVLKILSLPESERHVAQILMAGFIQNYALNLHGATIASQFPSSESGGQFATSMLGTMLTCLFFEGLSPEITSRAIEASHRRDSFGIGDYSFIYQDQSGKSHFGHEPAYYEIDPWVECLLGINNGAWTGNYQWNGSGEPKFYYCMMQSTDQSLRTVDFGGVSAYNATYNGVVLSSIYLFLQYPYFFKLFGNPQFIGYIANVWVSGMKFIDESNRQGFKARIEQLINHHNAKGADQIPLSKAELIIGRLEQDNGKVDFAYYNQSVYDWVNTHFGPHRT